MRKEPVTRPDGRPSARRPAPQRHPLSLVTNPPGAGSLPAAPPVANRDEDLGHIFRNMRLALRVSRETIARRLATSPRTIEDFENGAVAALPHWKETVRIVRGFCELLRLDPEPILWRLERQLRLVSQSAPAAPPPAADGPRTGAPWPHAAPPHALTRTHGAATAAAGPRRIRWRARALFAWTAPVALFGGLFYLTQVAPVVLYRAVSVLPAPLYSPSRAALDYVVEATAPTHDGLKWIEIGDPRLRKLDKLPTSGR
jgi:hypothetical protein